MTERHKITILTPTPLEFEAIEAAAALHGARLVVSGVGMAETASTLAGLYAENRLSGTVILAGIGGAYPISGLMPGDCVSASSETISDLGAVRSGGFEALYRKSYRCPFAENVKSLPTARFATVNCVNGPGSAGELCADIENMEGAAFFAVMTQLGLPFLEIRAVSNLTTDSRDRWQLPFALEALATGLGKVLTEISVLK